MLFEKQQVVKLYREGQPEPFLVFTIESTNAYLVDKHTLKTEASVLRFPADVFVSLG
jgi:hypothetical protein